MARQGQLIEVATHFARRKYELMGKWLRAGMDRTTVGAVPIQGAAVIVTVTRLVRIDPRTFAARLGHTETRNQTEGNRENREKDARCFCYLCCLLFLFFTTISYLLHEDFHLNRPDLNDIVDVEDALLTGIKSRSINESSIRAIQIFNNQNTLFAANQGVLARRPDAIRRLLIL
jgi:hypothetical protein